MVWYIKADTGYYLGPCPNRRMTYLFGWHEKKDASVFDSLFTARAVLKAAREKCSAQLRVVRSK